MSDQTTMREFLSACGAAGPLVLGVEEPGASAVSWRVFDQPFIVVGRDPGADLCLKDADVSRRHAYLQVIGGRLFCVDLQSRTGTRWGDEPGLWGWVHPGTEVRIGPFRLRTREDGPPQLPARLSDRTPDVTNLPVPLSRSFEQPDLAEATLEILGASTGPPSWRASRALVLVGGAQACKVRLQGGGVADIHASLLRTPSGTFAVDLLGPGGILVNGERARWARLGDDVISVGEHRVRVCCGPHEGHAGPLQATARPRAPARAAGGPARAVKVGKAAPGGGPGPGDDAVALLRTMLDEFGQAQAQMVDRFQESLLVVLRTFAGSQGEQMALIHEEMARIRESGEEQRALRSLAEARGIAIDAPPPPSPRHGAAGSHPRAGGRGSGATRAPVPGKDHAGPAAEGRAGRAGPAAPPASRPEEARPESPDCVDLHAQIARRLAEIQEERHGRWQKLMKTIIG